VFYNRLFLWVKSNKWICPIIAVACYFIMNGVFFYRTADAQGAKIVFTVLCVFFWCVICVTYFGIKRKKDFLLKAFLIILLALGTLHSFVFQPITIPDEEHHFENSYRYSSLIMLKNPNNDSLPIRSADSKEMEKAFSNRLSYQRYLEIVDGFELFAADKTETSVTSRYDFTLGSSPPQLFLPSAIGVTVARLIGLGFYPLFYLGRLFNFLYFALLSYFAIKITPIGKNVFMAAALLPMTVNIASSYSYDAGIIGLSFLLLALCFKTIYTSEQATRKDLIAIAVVVFLLSPCKIVYSFLAIIVLIIPTTVFSSNRKVRLYKASVITLSVFTVLLFRFTVLLYLTGIEELGVVNRGDEQGYYHTVSEFFTNPFGTIAIFFRTIGFFWKFYVSTLVGGSLGWFQGDIDSPWFIVLAFSTILFLSFLKTPEDDVEINNKHRALFLLIFCIGLFAIMLGMFTGWTFADEEIIQGIQGRYFLPFLPIIALAIRSNKAVLKRKLQTVIVFGLFAMNLAYLIRLFSIILTIV